MVVLIATYPCNAFIPALDHFTLSNRELKRLATSSGRIKDSSIDQRSRVVNDSDLTLFWVVLSY